MSWLLRVFIILLQLTPSYLLLVAILAVPIMILWRLLIFLMLPRIVEILPTTLKGFQRGWYFLLMTCLSTVEATQIYAISITPVPMHGNM